MKLQKLIIAIPIATLLLTGCTANTSYEKYEGKAKNTNSTTNIDNKNTYTTSTKSSSQKDLTKKLNSLKVRAENTSRYSRTDWKHWSNTSKGCNTRVEVLKQESLTKPVMKGCKIISGKWKSMYDGVTTTKPGSFDVDHMVPLKEAHASGGNAWSKAKKEKYANDMSYKNHLIAVSAKSNRSKSDKDPAEWLPAKNKCEYVAAWITIKSNWNLTVDAKEKRALTNTLKNCKTTSANATKKKQTESKPKATSKPKPVTKPKATSKPKPKTDPRFSTCTEAKKHGYGPYHSGKNPEYNWYQDRDKDGTVCER